MPAVTTFSRKGFTAGLCPKSCLVFSYKINLYMAGRRAPFQGPGKLHHTPCKSSSRSLLQSLCCPAAPALPVEPAGLHFSAVQTGKGKLIKPLPEGRMHQEGQVKPQAQQTQRQQPSLRPRLNNYRQSFPWTRQSWLFFSNRPTALGKPTIPKTFSINCPKELLANYWRHKSCRRLALYLWKHATWIYHTTCKSNFI